MRVVIAPDKFKGSLEAHEVAEHLARGLKAADASVIVDCVPVADGGEGTVDAALAAGWERVDARVTGPTGLPVDAYFAVQHGDDGAHAILEMAMASGLGALPAGDDGTPRLDAAGATSRGTGELILAALDAGCRTITLGVGGSACTDGGAGLVEALGGVLLDAAGESVASGGGGLAELATVDLSGLDRRIADCEFVLAADVDNPLTGPRGAAAVFGPQKGASPEDVQTLDANLERWRDVLGAALGERAHTGAQTPGAGAAGGVGYAALVVLKATRRPGVEVVLELVDLSRRVAEAGLVITGEGSLDEQSLGGKTPMGVCRVAREHGVAVVAVCGRTTLSAQRLAEVGFARTWALSDVEADVHVCLADAGRLLEHRVAPQVAEWASVPGSAAGT